MSFSVSLESIEDLFYDKTTDPDDEYLEVCAVLDSSTGSTILSEVFMEPMNRAAFTRYAMKTTGLPTTTASEIFSCATNCFGAPTTGASSGRGLLPDTDMTPSQFTHGTIMLANIFALMHCDKNTDHASKLGGQLIRFLDEVRQVYPGRQSNQERSPRSHK